jgi:hypothetical protein
MPAAQLDSVAASSTRPVSADDVAAAAARLSAVLEPTPLQLSRRLSDRMGGEVWLKREDLQPVRSYKVRGAYNLIAQLPAPSRRAGLVCASAGNHAQGVAYACALLGVAGTIYLPRTTPRQKLDRIAALGGEQIRLSVGGDSYDDSAAAALRHAEETGAVMVPAFDHPDTIAGQGSWAGYRIWWWCRSGVAGCSPARWPGCGPAIPGSGWSGWSPPGPPAWQRRCRPAGRWIWTRWTPSWTARRCAARAR